MRSTILFSIIMIPELLLAQFNLHGITASYERQQKMLAQTDSLFLNRDCGKACAMYSDIFSDHRSNRQYAIRQVRCRSLDESPSQQMVEFLYSHDVDKYAIGADTVLGPYLNDILSNMPENPFVKDVYNSLSDSLHTADQDVRFSGLPLSEMWKVDSLNYAKLYQVFSQTGKKYIGSLGSIIPDYAIENLNGGFRTST